MTVSMWHSQIVIQEAVSDTKDLTDTKRHACQRHAFNRQSLVPRIHTR